MSDPAGLRTVGGSDIDRERRISFQFNGKRLRGFAGDTLASALLANEVRVVGRSFKYHRPRGVFSCGLEEPNAFVQTGRGAHAVPSERATLVELHEGLEALVPSGWPSLQLDVGRLLDLTAPLWPAGFYNKTFMWPGWHAWEAPVRAMAGFGQVPDGPDPDRYEVSHGHCDVLVVGGGVTGLRAALDAVIAGKRIVLVEHGSALGGRAIWDGSQMDGVAAATWVHQVSAQLQQAADARVLTRTTATGFYDRDVITAIERHAGPISGGQVRERFHVIRAGRVVIAAGATEQPLIFSNNDRPGIMLAGAAREYLLRFGVVPGRQIVVAANNDSAYSLVRDLRQRGIAVTAIADSRRVIAPELIRQISSLGVKLLLGSIPVDTRGLSVLREAQIGRLSEDLRRVDSTLSIPCDSLLVSGGWSPNLQLYSQASGKLGYSKDRGAFEPAASHPVVTQAHCGGVDGPIGIRFSPTGNRRHQWVDLRHDVTVADIELALRENYTSIEHVKRYTTSGMAADQGKTSQLATVEIVAARREKLSSEIGHTTIRPPFVPVTLGAIAGRAIGERFAPERRLPLHDWHLANGAVMQDYGSWRRPAWYARAGEDRHQAMSREACSVREGAGLFDGSSLGKIEVHGPDAIEFLDRFYINNLKTLSPGRVRYGLMLRESGVIFDDGTVVQLAPDHALVTTTSANADRVVGWLEEWHQCEWPQMRVAITSVTEQWATLSLAGPKARAILEHLDTDIALSSEAFPHLHMREGHLLGHVARIYRVSFTGELTYEINVRSGAALEVWDALMKAGTPVGLSPFGIEALNLMRLEKGFLHVGTDTDGTTVPDDVGFGAVATTKRADFVGKRSLRLPENTRHDRLQLVGLSSDTGIVAGSHLKAGGSQEPTDGWVTSAGCTALTNEAIAMALLRSGRSLMGSVITVHNGTTVSRAKVVAPPFYDTDGARMRG